MGKTKTKSSKRKPQELDGAYLLKMAIYLVLGSIWVRVGRSSGSWQIPIPVGFIVGLFLAMKEQFQIDRKLEYAILLMSMFIGFWLPLSINITF